MSPSGSGAFEIGGEVEGSPSIGWRCMVPVMLTDPRSVTDTGVLRAVRCAVPIHTGQRFSAISAETAATLGCGTRKPAHGIVETVEPDGTVRGAEIPLCRINLTLFGGVKQYDNLLKFEVVEGLETPAALGLDALLGGLLTVDLIANRWRWVLVGGAGSGTLSPIVRVLK